MIDIYLVYGCYSDEVCDQSLSGGVVFAWCGKAIVPAATGAALTTAATMKITSATLTIKSDRPVGPPTETYCWYDIRYSR